MAADYFRFPAELQTERLLLRQWRPGDAERLAEIAAHRDYLEHMPALGLPQARALVEKLERGWREDGFSQWAAVDPESGRLIGRIGLARHHDWPLSADAVEVGWTLDRDYWGRGLATEGARAAVECWREHLVEEEQLISITTVANVRSRAVMERLALTYRGTARWRGVDVLWYAIDR
jgi:RimJ/RimL family protein N-acetyltransferase